MSANKSIFLVACLLSLAACSMTLPDSNSFSKGNENGIQTCFLLEEIGVGEIRHDPSQVCSMSLSPASTFKIPHALAALDAGVISGPHEKFPYDGSPQPFEPFRQDHDLASAMRYSVVWYFQQIAKRLGVDREQDYLDKFDYGNRDLSSGLTNFWLMKSLKISPEQQLRFLHKLYRNELPLSNQAVETVKSLLIQPRGFITNALGDHPFNAPWPADTIVSAKTGSGASKDHDKRQVRWLVGHIEKGRRAFNFVACVTGQTELAPDAAIKLAAEALHQEGIL